MLQQIKAQGGVAGFGGWWQMAAGGGVARQRASSGQGWAGSFLYSKADAKLTQLIDQTSNASPYRRCAASLAMLNNLTADDAEQRATDNALSSSATPAQLLSGIAHRLPCKCVPCLLAWAGLLMVMWRNLLMA